MWKRKMRALFDVTACLVTLTHILDIGYQAFLGLPYQDHVRTGNSIIDIGLKILNLYGISLALYTLGKEVIIGNKPYK
jgi:hypothetical protein